MKAANPMKLILLLSTMTVAPMWGADSPTRQVPVEITHEKGSFSGQLSVSLNGPMSKAKATWNANIRNNISNEDLQGHVLR